MSTVPPAPTLTRADTEKLAHLARLELTDTECEAFASRLDDILRYVQTLREVDTEGVEPTAHAVALPTPLRPDVVRPSLTLEAALANAPRTDGASFVVPKVV